MRECSLFVNREKCVKLEFGFEVFSDLCIVENREGKEILAFISVKGNLIIGSSSQ